MNYYTADLHFFHPGLCRARGFDSLEEMNRDIVKRLSFLGSNDDLFILGDVGYGYTIEHDLGDIVSLLKEVRCGKHLVVGNHDAWALRHARGIGSFRRRFESIEEHMLLTDDGIDLYLSHYPMVDWDGYYKGRWLFYGHVHKVPVSGPGLFLDMIPTAMNVGIDLIGRPRTAGDLVSERMSTWTPPRFDLMDAVIPRMDPALLNGKRGILDVLSGFEAFKGQETVLKEHVDKR